MKAMIFAAGLGTRLRPLTNAIPKALVPLKKKPLLHHAIDYLSRFGFNDIIVNVHHFADRIVEYLSDQSFDASVTISDERDKLLDTGGGLKNAAWFFDDDRPFLVYNSDVLTNMDLTAFYDYHQQNATIGKLAVRKNHSGRYLRLDDHMSLAGLGNKKTGFEDKWVTSAGKGNEWGFSGIHLLEPEIFKYMPDEEVFSILDVYKNAVRQGESIKGFDHSGSFWMDLGKPENLAAAEGLYDKVFR